MHGRGGPVLQSRLGPPPPEAGPWLFPRGTREQQACVFVPPHLATHHGSFRKHHTSDSPMAAAFGCDPTGQSGSWSCVPGPVFVLGRNPCAGGLLHPRQLSHSQRPHTWILGAGWWPRARRRSPGGYAGPPSQGCASSSGSSLPSTQRSAEGGSWGPVIKHHGFKGCRWHFWRENSALLQTEGGRCPLSLSFFPTTPRARAYQTPPVSLLM